MDIIALVGLIILEIGVLTLVLLVMRAKQTSIRVKVSFMLFMFSLAAWALLNYFSNESSLDYSLLLFINRLLFVSSAFIALATIDFVSTILRESYTSLRLICLIGTISASIISLTPAVVGGVKVGSQSTGIDFGVAAPVYFALIFISFTPVVAALVKGARASAAQIRSFARVLSYSIGGTIVVLCGTNVIAPLFFSNFSLSVLGPFFAVSAVVGISYAIVRHGMFDIRLAVARGTAYVLVLSAVTALYFGVIYVMSIIVHSPLVGPEGTLVYAGTAVLMAIVFQPLKLYFDKVTNRIFYRGAYDSDEFLMKVSRSLVSTTDLKTLLKTLGTTIAGVLHPNYIVFNVSDHEGAQTIVSIGSRVSTSAKKYTALDDYLRTSNAHVVVTEIADDLPQSIRDFLVEREIAIVVVLSRQHDTVTYMLVGERLSGGYVARDIRLLQAIAGEIVVAIQNAISVQEVKNLNKTLQHRIDDATRELRRSNTRLQRLDAAKDEFVSMASHQLRTPLTSVKGYLSMVLDGDAGEVTKEQRQLLQEAFTSSERMVHLIGDFLNVSRLQTGKFIIDVHATDLAKVVEQEVEGIRQIASSHGVKLVYKKPARFPELYVDENKIRQVIMNFIDNAIYYSPDSKSIKVQLSIEDGDAVVRIIDHGMGVPDAVQRQLFTRFFRAENARKQRPDGTGIGLYLARKIIVGHGGSIVFESKEGKGSTFGFRLPIKKLSTEQTLTQKITQ